MTKLLNAFRNYIENLNKPTKLLLVYEKSKN